MGSLLTHKEKNNANKLWLHKGIRGGESASSGDLAVKMVQAVLWMPQCGSVLFWASILGMVFSAGWPARGQLLMNYKSYLDTALLGDAQLLRSSRI